MATAPSVMGRGGPGAAGPPPPGGAGGAPPPAAPPPPPGWEAWKARGGAAFAAGRHAEAEAAYGAALGDLDRDLDRDSASGSAAEREARGTVLSNRAAARLAQGRARAALEDAELAVRCRPGWPKAHRREAAAREALGDLSGAGRAALAAFRLAPSGDHRAGLVRILVALDTSVRRAEAGTGTATGGRYACACGQPAFELLLRCCTEAGLDDRWVRHASLLQLAGLAALPGLRPRFLARDAAAAVARFAGAAGPDLDALFPPRGSLGGVSPAYPRRYAAVLGAEYEATHPKAACAVLLANLVRFPEPGAAAAVLASPDLLAAVVALAADAAPRCRTTVRALGTVARALVGEAERGGAAALRQALDGSLMEAVQKLGRASRELELAPEAAGFQRLYQALFYHPHHPDNQVPQET